VVQVISDETERIICTLKQVKHTAIK